MNKRKRLFRIGIFLVLITLSLALLYYGLEMPSLSPEMAMRRKEAAMLVGPSQIIAADSVEYELYHKILLGETEYGYCLYEYRERFVSWDHGKLTYIAKDDKRFCFVPNRHTEPDFLKTIPVYAIPKNHRAVYARLILETVSDEDPVYCSSVIAETNLRSGCYFLFEPDFTEVWIDVVRYWDNRLKGDDWVYRYMAGTVTLELFDAQGNLLETHTLEFPPIA
ncbi:MAG: hypothetical protein IKC09_08000 [Oscillospiraceae bacterium]|nr:hypothetical protein [Oscillospiraceae bacterium]